MITEIQKVPGNFQLPKDWPVLTFPDVDSGLLYDWVADDLAVGTNVATWADRVSGHEFRAMAGETVPWAPIPVVSIGGGHKAVKFGGASRLNATVAFGNDLTYCITYKMYEATSGASRIVSGQDSYRTWMTGDSKLGMTVNVAVNSSNVLGDTKLLGGKRDTWHVAATSFTTGRTKGNQIVGQILGGEMVTAPVAGDKMPEQTQMFIGFNPTTPPSTSIGFQGEIARITVWNRALTQVDIRGILRRRQGEYGDLLG